MMETLEDKFKSVITKLEEHGEADFIIAMGTDLQGTKYYKVSMAFYRTITNSNDKEIVDYELAGEGTDISDAIDKMLNDIPRYYNRD